MQTILTGVQMSLDSFPHQVVSYRRETNTCLSPTDVGSNPTQPWLWFSFAELWTSPFSMAETGIVFAHNSTTWAGLSWAVLLVSLLAAPPADAFSWLAEGGTGRGWEGQLVAHLSLPLHVSLWMVSAHQGLFSRSTRLSFTG